MRLLLAALFAVAPPLAAAPSPVTAWVGATLVDGTGAPPVPDAVVLVREGRVVKAGPRAKVRIPKNARVEDVAGLWITPGLVDAHVHFFQSGGLYTRPDIVDLRDIRPYEGEQARIRRDLEATFRRTLAAGVTGVVDMGGPFWNFDVQDRATMLDAAPAVAVAGPLISTVSREQLDLGDPPIIRAGSPDEARALARAQVAREPDLLKVWFIVGPDGDVSEGRALVAAVAAEADAAGVPLAVHATTLASARAAVEAGADVLVHSVDDAPIDDDTLRAWRAAGVRYMPTLAVYEGYAEVLSGDVDLLPVERRFGDPAVIASWGEWVPDPAEAERAAARVARAQERAPVMAENLRRVAAAGIPVAVGTDAGNIGTLHGPTFHRELQLMAEAGMAPMDLLVAATAGGAPLLGRGKGAGTVTAGQPADLLVLGADPLADVAHLQDIRRVVRAGVPFTPETLVPPNPEDVVARQVDAYNARDLEAFLAFFHPEVTIVRLPEEAPGMVGREAMREGYAAFFEASPELQCVVTRRIVSGDMVVDHERVTGARGGPPIRAVAIYQVEDGLIRRVWFLPREAGDPAP